MVQWSKELLETLFAPGIDDLELREIRDLDAQVTDPQWLQNHFLNSVFSARWNGPWRARFITMAFRAENALNAHRRARAACLDCQVRSVSGGPAVGAYFKAVAEFEMVVHNLHQGADVFAETNGKKPVEGTREYALKQVANRIKHVAEDFDKSEHVGRTIPMWLVPTGLQTTKAHVSFDDLADMILEVVATLDEMQHPAAMLKKHRP